MEKSVNLDPSIGKAGVSELCRSSAPCGADVGVWRISARTELYVCLWDSEKYVTGSRQQKRKNIMYETFQLSERSGSVTSSFAAMKTGDSLNMHLFFPCQA